MFLKLEEGLRAYHLDMIFTHRLKPCAKFETKGKATRPLFFETDEAIVFAPSSDTLGPMAESIKEILDRATKELDAKGRVQGWHEKILLFPIAEEQPSFIAFGPPRKHWVTLHYNPNTQTATLIDSRPMLNSCLYMTQSLRDLFIQGLPLNKFPHKKNIQFSYQYQGVQNDDIHCGIWTAMNIIAYAFGAPVEAPLFSAMELGDILQYLSDLVIDNSEKKPYRSKFIRIPSPLFEGPQNPTVDYSAPSRNHDNCFSFKYLSSTGSSQKYVSNNSSLSLSPGNVTTLSPPMEINDSLTPPSDLSIDLSEKQSSGDHCLSFQYPNSTDSSQKHASTTHNPASLPKDEVSSPSPLASSPVSEKKAAPAHTLVAPPESPTAEPTNTYFANLLDKPITVSQYLGLFTYRTSLRKHIETKMEHSHSERKRQKAVSIFFAMEKTDTRDPQHIDLLAFEAALQINTGHGLKTPSSYTFYKNYVKDKDMPHTETVDATL